MAAKLNWHRYGTKLRHRHPMHFRRQSAQIYEFARVFVNKLELEIRMKLNVMHKLKFVVFAKIV